MASELTAPLHATLVGEPHDPHQQRVVFLHGLFGRGKNFTRVATGLLPEALSLLVDLPNHGESGWTQSVDYAQIADTVAGFLREDCASTGPVDIVGHSMGGKVAMVLALRHPDLVRRLVVVDISPRSTLSSGSEFVHLLTSLKALDLQSLTRRIDASEALRQAIPQDMVRGFLLQNLIRTDTGFAWQPNLDVLLQKIDIIMGFPTIEEPQFQGPVLWIRGDQSNYVRDEDQPAMRALFPHAELLTVHGAGHWVHAEKTEEVIAALRGFLIASESAKF